MVSYPREQGTKRDDGDLSKLDIQKIGGRGRSEKVERLG